MPYKDLTKNREEGKHRALKWRLGNPEKYALKCLRECERAKKKRAENPEEARAKDKKYRDSHAVEIQRSNRHSKARHRSKIAEHVRKRRKEDLSFRLAGYLRNRIKAALKGAGKIDSTFSLLGMELKEFKIYLQGQFRAGMTWENYGPVWHVDHIIPCDRFDLTDPEQQKICFRWDNHQPLFAKENLTKGNKWQGSPI